MIGGDIIKLQDENDKNIDRKAYKKGNGLFSGLVGTVKKYDDEFTRLEGYKLVFSNGDGVFSKLEDLVFVDEKS